MKESFKDKQIRILRAMALQEIEDEVKKTKQFLENPGMINGVDLERVRKIIKNANPNDPFAKEAYLFTYKGKFHFIEAGQYRKIEDAEVRKQLDEHSDMKLYYICTNELMCPLPPSYEGKKAEGIMLKDDQAVIIYIKRIARVELKKTDL